jgi:acetoacetyl-CoA reductase
MRAGCLIRLALVLVVFLLRIFRFLLLLFTNLDSRSGREHRGLSPRDSIGPLQHLGACGQSHTRDGMFHKMTLDHWNAVINTNLNSLFNMCRPVIEGMRERNFGRIVNISSINGQKGQMGQSNYSAAKAGEIGFTKALAQENAKKGVTVNAICPGYIGTEMVRAVPKDVLEKNNLPQIPVGRLGEPEEIARCVVFLAADEAGFITGSTMTVNGGQYLA